MIRAQNVTKYFGGFPALKNISFEVAKGEIIGFLGQNGAGKTTLMRVLTTYLPASAGKVYIAGMDVSRRSLEIRRRVGYLPENPPLYGNMTIREYLKFAARLKDIPHRQQRPHVERVLKDCDLWEARDKVIATLSKGYKQRVGIAQAILHEPELLILDEPTSGLDPAQILQVRRLIKSLEYRRTVILSTHILSEIEQMAQRVLIIKSGEILADSSIENLLKGPGGTSEDGRRVCLRVQGVRLDLEPAIGGIPGIKLARWASENNTHGIDLEMTHPSGDFNELAEKVARAGGRILEIKESKVSLEEVFLQISGNKDLSHSSRA
ncbi:MAG TPA: MFS transporter [Candidatus Omnitrophica bacterium]|nr:MAG: hypothetical protein A2Z81_00980 [Omnitrophica WOR_2 bacterium GWA2_45_18]OGX19401.1 MAG: hypothetical protein A2Y04_00410 [Omnitrophica WOR_2 bacterium GWC2_45_7]HBR14555.1 MFS transporter [Candidatus Omnitrophota bacterium]